VLVGELKNDEVIYTSATSCLMSLGNAAGKHIVTVEGVNTEELNFIQKAMAEEGATQCGFCTPGFVVSLAGYCLSHKSEETTTAIQAIDGNICRCTGYKSIERAAKKITDLMDQRQTQHSLEFSIQNGVLPEHFSKVKSSLAKLQHESSQNGKPHSDAVKFLAGGTDLYVQQHETMVESKIEFLANLKPLKGISQDSVRCVVGGAATVTDIAESPVFKGHFPYLKKIIKLVSSTPIRNMATIAGNFINASPIGDLTIMFLALDAQVQFRDGTNIRELPLRKLYKGYKQLDKSPAEILEHVSFELPSSRSFFNFEKVSKRTHLDIASVNSACLLEVDEDVVTKVAISAGGVGPIPMYLSQTSEFLTGKTISSAFINEAIAIAMKEISPISDARGSTDYKRLLLTQLIKCHFHEYRNTSQRGVEI
jgi:xanthine dehydrogenase small subunit